MSANKKIVETSERQLEAQIRPYIDISPRVREGSVMYQLRIANTGRSSASNLKLRISPDFHQFHEKTERRHLQRFHAFSDTIETFAPGMELIFDLGVGFRFYEGGDNDLISPPMFVVTASYSGEANNYHDRTVVDLRALGGMSAASVGVVKELKELNKQLELLVDAFSKSSARNP